MSQIPLYDARFLPHLTRDEVARLPKERAVVVLPIASIEQHGPHLPVYTDSIIAQEILHRALDLLPADLPIWTLPLLAYGKSNEHNAFAGTIALTAETLMHVVRDIAAAVARSGFHRFAVFSAHGGNTELLEMIIRDIREQTGLLTFAPRTKVKSAQVAALLSDDEKTLGIHGGDVETSILLRCRPDLVKMHLAPNTIPDGLRRLKYPPFGGALHFAWLTQDVTDTGALGNATIASADRGELFLADRAEQLAEMLREITDFQFGK